MSLSAHEQEILNSIEDGIAGPDPHLASLLAAFAWPAAGEPPARTRIRTDRQLAWPLLGMAIFVALIAVALVLDHGGGTGACALQVPACAGQASANAVRHGPRSPGHHAGVSAEHSASGFLVTAPATRCAGQDNEVETEQHDDYVRSASPRSARDIYAAPGLTRHPDRHRRGRLGRLRGRPAVGRDRSMPLPGCAAHRIGVGRARPARLFPRRSPGPDCRRAGAEGAGPRARPAALPAPYSLCHPGRPARGSPSPRDRRRWPAGPRRHRSQRGAGARPDVPLLPPARTRPAGVRGREAVP